MAIKDYLYFVTKKPGKLMAAKKAFTRYDLGLKPVSKDFPEIQAESSLEIARFTALQAALELGHPSVREDHSFFIHALDLPGPYTNYVEKRLSAAMLIKLIDYLGDNTAHFEVATVLAYPAGKTIEYVFQVPVTLGSEVKGKDTKGWNGIIRLYDEKRAITEYPEEERLHIWNKGYEEIARQYTSAI